MKKEKKFLGNKRDKANANRKKLAEDAACYISEQIDTKVTVSELAAYFHVSETHIKNCFKSAYGTSVHAYITEKKMRSAAEDIKGTDTSILEIAGKYGFDNGSKFAKAFCKIMGDTPNSYRMKNRGFTASDKKRIKGQKGESKK